MCVWALKNQPSTAVKPLTRHGLKTSVFLGLRDSRFKIYQDALLGMVESSLYKDPIYFNCYPNFPVSLTDEIVLKTLELDVELHVIICMKVHNP